MEDLSQFWTEDVIVQDRMVKISDDVTLRVVTFITPIENENPSVVFVAGWITQMIAWKSVLKEMTKDFNVIYVETREKISSCLKRKADCDVTTIGKDIAKLVDKLNLREGRYVLFGSSLGATVIVDCFQYLMKKPLALVLIGPNAVFRVPRIWHFIVKLFYPPLYALIRPSVKWYLKNFRLDVKADRQQYEKYCQALDAADPWKLKKAVLAVEKYEIWDRLKSICCPTLLVSASKDVLHEPENLRKMASIIPQTIMVDLETNKITHSERVVEEFRHFLT